MAHIVKGRLANIPTCLDGRNTNAGLEALNNRITGLVKQSYGYR